MQYVSMARRIKLTINSEEIQGLVRFGEVALESHVIDVPTFNRIVKIQSGIVTMPEVTMSFETRSDGATRRFFRQWWRDKTSKSMYIQAVDATGQVFEEVQWHGVEIRRLSEPEMDLANPTYARFDVTVLPYDIQPVEITTAQTQAAPQ